MGPSLVINGILMGFSAVLMGIYKENVFIKR